MPYEQIEDYNDIYEKYSTDWDFFEQSYIGGRRYITNQNLFRHSREDQDDFNIRMKRSPYINYCRPIIDIYTSFIFGIETNIARNTENEIYRSFIEDADYQGHNMHTFMEQVATFAMVYGHVGVVVDMPQSEMDIISMADLQATDIRPYCTWYDAKNITNWRMDKFNQLLWVRLRELDYADIDPFVEQSSDYNYQYRTWTRTGWYLHDSDGNLKESGDHGLGVVPFISVQFKENPIDEFVGMSRLTDIAPINRLLTNVISYIEEFVSKQAFPFLATPDDPIGAGIQQEEEQVISSSNVYQFPAGSQPPQYVSPPTDPATFMREFASDYLVKEMLRLAHLEFRELAEQSGVAKQYDFHQLNQVLVRFSRTLEATETKMARVFDKWMNTETDYEVDYPDDFQTNPVQMAIENGLEIRKLMGDKSPTFVNAHLRKLMEQLEPKLSSEIQRIIDAEMDESTQTELIMTNIDETVNGNGNFMAT